MNELLFANASAVGAVIFYVILIAIVGIPAYVVGERRRVASPGLAFVPLVGPYIPILRSIGRSGWMCLLAIIPLVNIVFGIWLAFTVPAEHGRTRWWGLAFIIPVLDFFAFYAYAFTLARANAADSAPAGYGGSPV